MRKRRVQIANVQEDVRNRVAPRSAAQISVEYTFQKPVAKNDGQRTRESGTGHRRTNWRWYRQLRWWKYTRMKHSSSHTAAWRMVDLLGGDARAWKKYCDKILWDFGHLSNEDHNSYGPNVSLFRGPSSRIWDPRVPWMVSKILKRWASYKQYDICNSNGRGQFR